MNVAVAECNPVIVAGTVSPLRLALNPWAERETIVRLSVTPGVSVGRIALALADGTLLACRAQRKGSRHTIRCGPVRSAAILTVELSADVPVIAERARVRVWVNEREESLEIRLEGCPNFVADRCRLIAEPNPIEPGSSFALRASLLNDGTAASDAELLLRLPAGVFVPAPPAGAWWSLDERERRILVVPTGPLPVGEMVEMDLPMEVDGVVADAKALVVEASVNAAGETFALDPAGIAITASAGVELIAILTDPARTFRYGDRIEIALRVRGLGNDAARGVTVTLPPDFVAWDGALDAGLRLDLGTVVPGSEATLVCTGRVIASPSQPQTKLIEPMACALYGEVRSTGATCSLNGEARLDARGFVEDVDARGCHEVRVVLSNVGDGEAESLVLRTARVPGVRAIVDSLAVDGEPVYELDGSLRIEAPAGLTLGPLGIRSTRTVSWLVRAEKAGTFAIPLWLRHGERECHSEIAVQRHEGTVISNGPRATTEDRVVSARAPRDVRDEGDASVAEDLDVLGAAGADDDRLVGHDWPDLVDPFLVAFDVPNRFEALGTAPVLPDAPSAAEGSPALEGEGNDVQAEVAPCPVFAIDMETRALWMTWFPESPRRGESVGRFLLASRAFLPREIAGAQPPIAALLLGLRSEVEAVHEAIARSSRDTNTFAPSGYDFGTAPLRATVRSLAETFALTCHDLEGVGLERALVSMSGGIGTASAHCIARFRAALLEAIERCRTISEFGDAAPDGLVVAAEAVHASLLAVATPSP